MTVEPAGVGPDERLVDAAMRWLRAVLVPPPPSPDIALPGPVPSGPASAAEAPGPVPAPPPWYSGLVRPRRREDLPPVLTATSTSGTAESSAVRQARQDLVDAMAAVPAPRFTRFCDTFELGAFERDVLLLCFAHAVSTEVARLCAAMPEAVGGCPTFALSLGLAADPEWDALPEHAQRATARRAAEPAWDALGPDRPLRLWRLLEITQPGGQPLVSSPLRADERIVNHLMGHDYVDDRIAPLCRPAARDGDRGRLSGSQRAAVDDGLAALAPLAERRGTLLVQLPGGDGPTKRLFAAHLAGALGLELYRVTLAELSPADADGGFARLWNRERYLQRVAVLLEASSSPETTSAAGRVLQDVGGLVLLAAPEPVPGQDTALLLDVSRPTPLEQRALWLEVLGGDQQEWADRLTGQFDLNVGEIADSLVGDGRRSTGEQLWARQRSRGRARLEGLAQRTASTTTLADVQLPAEEMRMLHHLRDQVRHRALVYDRYGFRSRLPRGLGITALFAGQSGTGKSMAAEALANELQLDLYRIDLAGVVSKYIGETEKNLRRLFDAAEQSGAVLLFDEADAVFGKRSEVHDSHDRYANIEVSYLLQRMEAYSGLALLTTNMKSALDPAFLRRLRVVVAFPFPGPEQRRAIWQGVLPDTLPGARELDLDALAAPALTGGQIRNIAVNAAFLAAADTGAVSMEQLREAAREELRKHGQSYSAADFAGWHSPEPAPVPASVKEAS